MPFFLLSYNPPSIRFSSDGRFQCPVPYNPSNPSMVVSLDIDYDHYESCICAAGFESVGNQSLNCTSCSIGMYRDGQMVLDGMTRCGPCPTNTSTVSKGASSLSQCTCIEGLFFNSFISQCDSCASGRFKPLIGNDIITVSNVRQVHSVIRKEALR